MNADSPVLWEGDLAQLPGQLPVHRRFRRSSAANIPFFLITQLQPSGTRQAPAPMHVQGPIEIATCRLAECKAASRRDAFSCGQDLVHCFRETTHADGVLR
jgi:hypothetical protein